MQKNLFCVVLCWTLSSLVHSQDIESFEPVVVPPNPTACQLLTHGNIPIINCTGTFSYSIPVYTINYKDISLPITLNYGSNGVKVDQLPSMVGTDWSLNTGGIISRVTNGRPDDSNTRWYPNTMNVNDPNFKTDIVNLGLGISMKDTEQDWFSFNANGISGSFFFDEQRNIHVNCGEYVKIESTGSPQISTFTLTDNKGYKYIFGGSAEYLEETTSGNEAVMVPKMITCYSSWYLKEIISPTLNKITFSYSGKNYLDYIAGISDIRIYSQKEFTMEQWSSSTGKSIQRVLSSTPLLKKICFANDSIVFGYEGNANYEGGSYLKDIFIKHAGVTLKKVTLAYDIIQGVGTLPMGVDSRTKNRLFLNNVSFLDKTNTLVEKYQFEYYLLSNVPSRLSYSKDKFGYPGYDSSSPFSKKVWDEYLCLYRQSIGDLSNLFSANIEVNPARVYAGMLKKITYPTGGYTEILYEANSTKENIVKDSIIQLQAFTGCNPPSGGKFGRLNCFVIDNASYGKSLKISATAQYQAESGCPQGDEGIYLVEVKNSDTNQLLYSKSLSYAWWMTNQTNISATVSLSGCQIGHAVSISISPQHETIPGAITVSVSYPVSVYDYVYGGGARVKEIADYTDGKAYHKRQFYYNALAKYPSEVSTMLPSLPANEDYVRKGTHLIYQPSLLQFLVRDQLHISPFPMFSYYRNRGRTTNYTIITELFETTGSSNGAIERTFKNATAPKENGWFHGPAPLSNTPTSNINESLKDKLATEKVFKKQGSNYVLASRKEYKYQLLYEKIMYSYIFSCPDMSVYIYANQVDYVTIANYKNYIQNYQVNQVVDSLFESSGTIIKTTDYVYGGSPHYNLTKQEEKMSDGNNLAINYKYAPDLNGQQPNMDKLITANRVGEPVIIEKTKNTNIPVSAIKTEYLYENNMVLPQAIYNKTGNNADYLYLSFNKYDGKGNLLQYTPHSCIPTIYLWGYNYQYPIAKIENATYTEVETAAKTVFAVANMDSLSALITPNETKLKDGSLQKALPNALVTTYTYAPLHGLQTITDPGYKTTTYDYDPFGRLQTITDHNGKIMERYDYHYKP